MFIVGVSVAEVPKGKQTELNVVEISGKFGNSKIFHCCCGTGKEEGRLVALVFFSIFFVTCVVGVVLGILLLFGTKKVSYANE